MLDRSALEYTYKMIGRRHRALVPGKVVSHNRRTALSVGSYRLL
jgi:hypothetical protein